MSQPKYIIGIDGGGTKTSALISLENKKIVLQLNAGASNPHVVGFDMSAKVISKLITRCCDAASCEISAIKKIVIGLAGVGRETDRELFLRHLKLWIGEKPLQKIIALTDVSLAMEAAFPLKNEGIVVIAGTGSIVLFRNHKNKIVRAGGWGRILGDDGSGFAIARDAIREVLKEHEGRTGKTLLTQNMFRFFKLRSAEQIISYLSSGASIAEFAPEVIKAASKGDSAAKDVLTINALALAEAVETVLVKSRRKKKIPLVLFGSLLQHRNLYSRMVREIILGMVPNVVIMKPEYPPVYGALFLATKSLKKN